MSVVYGTHEPPHEQSCKLCLHAWSLAGQPERLDFAGMAGSLSVIIIMYFYHALINALSAHTIHINLNIIFYTHAEHLLKQFT